MKVAVGGLEPPTSCQYVGRNLQVTALCQLSYTTHHIYSLIQAAGSHTSLRQQPQSPSALLDLQSGFRISIRFACCCVTATIQPSIPTTSLGLTLLPICSVCCCVTATVTHQPVVLSDSEITFSRWQYFTTLFHAVSFHTIWLFASSLFRCRFSSGLCTTPCGITRHPSCHCVSVYSAYLPGLLAARPSAFAEGAGFEPAMGTESFIFAFDHSANLPVLYVAMA